MGRAYESASREAQGRPLEPFTLDGVQFSPRGDLHLLDLAELARHADDDVDSPAGLAALADFYEGLLGKTEYKRFRAHTREHDTAKELLAEIMNDVVRDVTGREKARSTPSAPGRSNTGSTSRAGSRSPEELAVIQQAADRGHMELTLVPPSPETVDVSGKRPAEARMVPNRAARRAKRRRAS
jgi:hypothetical protein